MGCPSLALLLGQNAVGINKVLLDEREYLVASILVGTLSVRVLILGEVRHLLEDTDKVEVEVGTE